MAERIPTLTDVEMRAFRELLKRYMAGRLFPRPLPKRRANGGGVASPKVMYAQLGSSPITTGRGSNFSADLLEYDSSGDLINSNEVIEIRKTLEVTIPANSFVPILKRGDMYYQVASDVDVSDIIFDYGVLTGTGAADLDNHGSITFIHYGTGLTSGPGFGWTPTVGARASFLYHDSEWYYLAELCDGS